MKEKCFKIGVFTIFLTILFFVSPMKADAMQIFVKTISGKHITLEVASRNTTAIHLYEKLNFQKISIRKNYYRNGDDAIIMVLSLS